VGEKSVVNPEIGEELFGLEGHGETLDRARHVGQPLDRQLLTRRLGSNGRPDAERVFHVRATGRSGQEDNQPESGTLHSTLHW
jgi:hypothetical protein